MDCGSYINHIRVDRSFIPYCGVNLQIAIMYKLARSILAINLINLLSSVSLLGGSYDHLKVGDKAPDFEAIVVRGDEEKKVLRLSDYKGQNVVIVFYFMDNTPYCTSQMKSLKERYDELEERGYVVLGISKDSVASHKKFSKKHDLPFFLISDKKGDIHRLYGTLSSTFLFFSRTKRMTFMIDREGRMKGIIEEINYERHADQIIALHDKK